MKKIIWFTVLIALMILFVAVPVKPSDLVLSIQVREYDDGETYLYYGTQSDPDTSERQISAGAYDREGLRIKFKIPADDARQLVSVRIDFPELQQEIIVTDVSVSAAGVVKARYNPCDFFSEDNVIYRNDIENIWNVSNKAWTHIITGESDPFIVLSQDEVQEIASHISRYRLTRIGICLLVLAAVYFYNRPIYIEKYAEEN